MTDYSTLTKTWSKQTNLNFQSSIWWNVLNSNTHNQRVDMCKIHSGDKNFQYRWMRKLLESSEMTMDILPDVTIEPTLRQLYIEAKAKAQLGEKTTYGFGYPLVVTQGKNSELVVAPLFVWTLNFSPLENETYTWRLSRSTKNPILINHYLLHFLEKERQLTIDHSYKNAVQGNHLNALHLLKLSNEIALKLQFDGNLTSLGLEELPSEMVCQEIAKDKGKIFWSGVFGTFPNLSIKPLKLLERAAIDFSKNIPLKRKHTFSALMTDPMQEKVLQGLEKSGNIVIEGLRNTGKTYTTTAIISNALSNGQKVMVLCNNSNTLARLKDEMTKQLGFENLCMTLTDLEDKASFLKALEHNVQASRTNPPFAEEEYQHLLNQLNRNKGKLDRHYESLNRPIFNGKKWIEIVGEFLECHYIEGKQLLNSQLLASDYVFDDANFERLRETIERARNLFSKIKTLSHPLEVLHADIFTQKPQDEAREFTTNKIEESIGIISEVYHQYVMKLEDYGESLGDLYDEHYQVLIKKTQQIHEDISDYQKRYGDDFDTVGVMKDAKLKFFGIFSERSRKILEVKNDLLEKYQDLKNTYWNKRYFDYTFSEIKGGLTFEKIAQNLEDFEATLKVWKQQLATQIHNQVLRLSSQTIHPHIEFDTELVDLKTKLTQVVQQLNDTALYQKPFSVDELLMVKNRAFLAKVADQYEGLQFHLRDFDDYYNWKSFWLPLDESTKNLIKALIKTKPEDWETAFKSWFLHHVLQQFSHNDILQDGALQQSFLEQHTKIRELIPLKIKNYWSHRQSSTIRELKKADKSLHNTLFGKRKTEILQQASVQSLIQERFDFWTTMFPVFCTTPLIANEYLPLKEHQFDLVVIENANQIVVADAVRTMWSGKQIVITGDGQLETFDNSVLAYAKNTYPVYELGNYYETSTLGSFKRVAFGNNYLKSNINESINNLGKFEVIYAMGRCSEETRTNSLEIEAIVRKLEQMEVEASETIGVLTFTKEQRNSLIDKLHGESQHKNLKVYTAEEAIDHSFDHLIISTTFSPEADIPYLNDAKGYMALYQAINATKDNIIICTSLPKDYIKAQRFTFSNQGLNTLCNLITYVEARQTEDEALQTEILDSLRTTPAMQPPVIDSFKRQLIQQLSKYIDADRIQDDKQIGGLNFDFVVTSIHKNEPAVAFWLDGLFWRYAKGGYLWEEVNRNQTKDLGYQYHNIWSVDWWKKPEKAPRQLAEQIFQHDKAYALLPNVKTVNNLTITEPKPTEVMDNNEDEDTANNVSDVSEA